MAFLFPNLHDTRCQYLTACGQIKTDDPELAALLEKSPAMDARYRTAGKLGYVFVMSGGRSGMHFHIDVAKPEYFEGHPPSPSHKIGDIRKLLAAVDGHEIETEVIGTYEVSQAELPPIIRSALVESNEGDVTIKTRGGKLSITGAPIHQLEWSIPKTGAGAIVELSAYVTLPLNDSYLQSCLDIIDPAFHVFVLGNDF